MENKKFVTLGVKSLKVVDAEGKEVFSVSLIDLVFMLWHAKQEFTDLGYLRDAQKAGDLAAKIMESENYLIAEETRDLHE